MGVSCFKERTFPWVISAILRKVRFKFLICFNLMLNSREICPSNKPYFQLIVKVFRLKVLALVFVFVSAISFSRTEACLPTKCENKMDSLTTVNVKKAEAVENSLNPCENKEKKESKDLSMMSLNIVYFLINKYINNGAESK